MADTDDRTNTAPGIDARPEWVAAVQQVLDAMPGNHALVLPEWDETATEPHDFRVVAAALGTIDAFGRTADTLLGTRVQDTYGAAIQGEQWREHVMAYLDGVPRRVGPLIFPRTSDRPPVRFWASLRRIGSGMLISWSRDDDAGRIDERLARTERLASLGWSERDLVTGSLVWSDHLYRIMERDPAEGPMSEQEIDAITAPEDHHIRHRAFRQLEAGEAVDVTQRIHLGDTEKHVRVTTETVRDVYGRPLKNVGIVQDITARVSGARQLAGAERRLVAHQQALAGENRLVRELQEIILPIPSAPMSLPGLDVAVRYLPAEQATRIGGDWYHAAVAYDGSVVLAVGDVAGHGIRAAAAMAQQRQALATLVAAANSEPSELLGRLNRLVGLDDSPSGFASAVVMRLDPADGTVRWAQAGHPPPLRTRDGITTALPRPSGMVLGVAPGSDYPVGETTLDPGDLMLLYTDGLIERRGRSHDEGLREVIATLDRRPRDDPQGLTDLLGRFDRASPDDDTCLLVVRRLPTGARQVPRSVARPATDASPPTSETHLWPAMDLRPEAHLAPASHLTPGEGAH